MSASLSAVSSIELEELSKMSPDDRIARIVWSRIQNDLEEKDSKDLDDICDECKEEHESVTQNLILTGFKICKSCRTSKTIFPI